MKVLTVALNDTKLVGASTLLAAANPRRSCIVISNSSDVGIWISFGEAAVIGQGIYLAPAGGTLTITDEKMWRGAIYGIAASGSNKVVGVSDLQ